MPTVLSIHHVPYERLAGLETVLAEAGFDMVEAHVGQADFAAIDLIAPDLVVILGGPMGVYEQADHPWMAAEIAKIGDRVARDRPTLGICLGAQVLAAAMGARVFAGDVHEAGYHPLELTAAGRASPLALIAEVPVLHWHGDSFDLPAGTELLASTAAYRNQAFRRGSNILGLQCHPEMGADWLEPWLANGERWLAKAGYSVAQVRREAETLGPAALDAGRALFRRWLGGLRP